MNTLDLLALGEPVEYGRIDPCCIDGCVMRASNFLVVANDNYELCDFHYAEYMLLYAHQKQQMQDAIDKANELMT